jgi:hypothetical protein
MWYHTKRLTIGVLILLCIFFLLGIFVTIVEYATNHHPAAFGYAVLALILLFVAWWMGGDFVRRV